MKEVDYLIVGQGMAGSLLAHELLKRNKAICIFDPGLEGSASVVGAGIVNPVTGRRIVKSWLIDEYLPQCRATYQELEKQLAVHVFFPRNVLRVFYKAQQENDWLAKTQLPEFSNYVLAQPEPQGYDNVFKSVFGWGEVGNAYWCDMRLLVREYRKYLKGKGLLREEALEYNDLSIQEDCVRYKDFSAKRIVFAEGWKSASNPFFSYLPHDPAKGEVLLIRLNHPPLEKIAKSKIFLVPWKDDLYWAGSRYIWHRIDSETTVEEREKLKGILDEVLQVDYEIVDQLASVRPVFKGRRPMIGIHPEHDRLAIFNGLGTKGASQAPYWAKKLAAFLEGEEETLNSEADVRRIK